jgi:hypothetical protein
MSSLKDEFFPTGQNLPVDNMIQTWTQSTERKSDTTMANEVLQLLFECCLGDLDVFNCLWVL